MGTYLLVAALGIVLAGSPQETATPQETVGSVILMASVDNVPTSRLRSALQHQDPNVRAAAGRVISTAGLTPLFDDVQAALARETDEPAAVELVRAVLYLRRTEGLPIVEPDVRRLGRGAVLAFAEWLARNEPARFAGALPDLISQIDSGNRWRFAALVRIADQQLERPQLSDRFRDLAAAAGWKLAAPGAFDDLPVNARVMPVWLDDLIGATSAAAECPLRDREQFGYIRIKYRPDGRPQQVGIDAGTLGKACAMVLEALGRTILVDEGPVPAEYQWVMVPLMTSFAACTRRPEPKNSVRVGPDPLDPTGKRIQTPVKTRNVSPEYPKELQRQRVQGMVIQEAMISSEGCLRSVRILKSSSHLGLDLAAMRAVIQWTFTPTLLDGTPVPVIMTVTTNFTLQ